MDVAKETLAYFAGLVDGEGCIRLDVGQNDQTKSRTYCPIVIIGNTNKTPLELGYRLFGGRFEYRSNQGKPWRPCWIWKLTRNACYEFLSKIYPYLIIKKAEAGVLLEYQQRLIYFGNPRTPEMRRYKEEVHLQLQELKRAV